MNTTRHAKVLVDLDDADDAGDGVESLWAARSNVRDALVLDNIPLLHKGLSSGDQVRGRPVAPDVYQFEEVVVKSPNSTVQLVGDRKKECRREVERWLSVLGELGCKFEGGGFGNQWRYGVSVPPSLSLDLVSDFLEVGEAEKLWSWRVSNERHPSNDKAMVGTEAQYLNTLSEMLRRVGRSKATN